MYRCHEPSDLSLTEVTQHMCQLLATQSCPTLCGPKDCNLPVSSVHGILQARILEWVVTAFSRASFQPRDQTRVFCIAGRFFTMVNPKGSPQTPLFNHKVSNELLLHSYHFSQDQALNKNCQSKYLKKRRNPSTTLAYFLRGRRDVNILNKLPRSILTYPAPSWWRPLPQPLHLAQQSTLNSDFLTGTNSHITVPSKQDLGLTTQGKDDSTETQRS